MPSTGESTVCAGEPRLFVGQVPLEATVDELAALFRPFAARGLRALNLVKRPDGVSKGCAMVLFERWAEAEAAQEAHNGRTRLNGGRPLVVTFANPKRIRPGEPPEPAIAPRKLFIGQVPKDATERDLRPLFEPFGEIICLNVLRTQRGQGPSAGCAFVEFRKWAQAERAMEAHNGVTRLPGSEMPLVVKFADAKRPEALYQGRQGWPDMQHGLGHHQAAYNPLGAPGHGMQPGLDPSDGLQFGAGLSYGLGADGPLHQLGGPLASAAANPLLAGMDPATAAAAVAATGGMPPQSLGRTGDSVATPAGLSPTAEQAGQAAALLNNLNNLSLSDQASLAGAAAGLQAAQQAAVSEGNLTAASAGSLADAAAQLAAINADAQNAALSAALSGADGAANLLAAQQVLQQQQQGGLPPLVTSGAGSSDMPTSSPSAIAAGFAALQPSDMANLAAAPSAGSMSGTATGNGGAGMNGGIANGLGSGVTGMAYLGGLAPLGGAGGRLGELGSGGGGTALPGGGAAGSRSLDHAASQWKLFIGQVPMEATEQDLWALFAPLGEVLELYVLRNNQTGRSRGCAFVTYASRSQAQQAITALNGRQVGGGKTLVVKYADRVPI